MVIFFSRAFLCLSSVLIFSGEVFAQEWTPRDIAGRSLLSARETPEGKLLEVSANCSASGFFRKEVMDASLAPRLRWRWMISNVLPGADERSASTDDSAARLLVFFDAAAPRESLFSKLRYHLAVGASGGVLPEGPAIAYVWSSALPIGTKIRSPFTERVQIIVLRNRLDKQKIGKLELEERDLVKDFKDSFGAQPKRVLGVAVMADADQTCQAATASFSDIRLEAGS